MKKSLYFALVLILSSFCNIANAQDVPPAGTPYLTLTVTPGAEICFDLQTIGTNKVWLDLGDGSYMVFTNTSANWIGDTYVTPITDEIKFYGNLYKFYSIKNGSNITGCDPTQMADLMWLELEGDQLSSIDVSQNFMLQKLYLEDNNIENLDVRNLPNLARLYCRNNGMTSLLVDGCTSLFLVYCEGNLMEACALDSLYMGLNTETNGLLYLETIYFPGNPGQSTSTTTIATDKGWNVCKWVSSGNSTPIVGDGTGCEHIALTEFDGTKTCVYPNPVYDELNIKGSHISSIEITDIFGHVMMSQKNIDVNSTVIHTDKYKSGFYFVRMNSEAGNETYKIVVK